ncbi:MAG: hypothetical protein KGI97_08310, partial [Alphaproteobacteria bacterium]|nr:hypothetical protein [Alphaproteobacteria bacterium]
AEARLEAAKRDAEAQVTLATASAQAIKLVTETLGDKDGPMSYLLGEKYIRMMEKMAGSPNGKFVVLPADLQDTVRGLLGRGK